MPRLEAIVRRLRSQLKIPFTVKIRAGFKCVNAPDVARLLEQCGVDALAIHPRLQTQYFECRPDYAVAAQVKQAVKIPVILSGNVVNFATARSAYEQTGADAFLIGRGIWGRPWKLLEMREHAAGNQFEVTKAQMLTYALAHLESMLAYYGPRGLFAFRKHLPFYLRGVAGALRVRATLVVSNSPDEVRQGLRAALAQE